LGVFLTKSAYAFFLQKNRKKFIFELDVFIGVKFAADHDANVKIMFPACFGVEKRFLLRPDFFFTAESCVF